MTAPQHPLWTEQMRDLSGSFIFIRNCLNAEVAKQLSEALISTLNMHTEIEIEMGAARRRKGGRGGEPSPGDYQAAIANSLDVP